MINEEEKQRIQAKCVGYLKRWTITTRPVKKELKHHKVAWIEAEGISLQVWSISSMENIANLWGEFLTVDDSTLRMEDIQSARIMLWTKIAQIKSTPKTLASGDNRVEISITKVTGDDF